MSTYQTKLEDLARNNGWNAPIYNIVSDRRGGRTAWSSTVTIGSYTVQARFWYDGQYIQNAREDAAQVAYEHFSNGNSSVSTNNNRYASTSAST